MYYSFMKIFGLDEAGRGALAGPLVATAVALNYKSQILRLKDSKKLSLRQRERFYELITNSGAEIKTEIISVRQINNRGIGWANKEVFKRLIRNINADKYIIDGNMKLKVRGKTDRMKSIVAADATRKCVMAASIIAKVTRDRLMAELHEEFPLYGWKENAGYGTKKHIEAILKKGKAKHHRDVYVTTALKKYQL